jgi:hypothetical protein
VGDTVPVHLWVGWSAFVHALNTSSIHGTRARNTTVSVVDAQHYTCTALVGRPATVSAHKLLRPFRISHASLQHLPHHCHLLRALSHAGSGGSTVVRSMCPALAADSQALLYVELQPNVCFLYTSSIETQNCSEKGNYSVQLTGALVVKNDY